MGIVHYGAFSTMGLVQLWGLCNYGACATMGHLINIIRLLGKYFLFFFNRRSSSNFH